MTPKEAQVLTEASANDHLSNFFRQPPTKGFYDPNVLQLSNSIEASSQVVVVVVTFAQHWRNMSQQVHVTHCVTM